MNSFDSVMRAVFKLSLHLENVNEVLLVGVSVRETLNPSHKTYIVSDFCQADDFSSIPQLSRDPIYKSKGSDLLLDFAYCIAAVVQILYLSSSLRICLFCCRRLIYSRVASFHDSPSFRSRFISHIRAYVQKD